MFENVLIRGCHASRYIMSWIREGGTFTTSGLGYYGFGNWLKSLGLNDLEIDIITDIARNGKLELEMSAKQFLKDHMKSGKYDWESEE